MDPTTNGVQGLREGAIRLTTPPRVIALGFYDGPTNGIVQFADGSVFRFDQTDEPDPYGGARSFCLAPLPADAFDRLTAVIVPHIPATWPVWVPVWRFPTPEIQRAVEVDVEAILTDAGPMTWLVSASDSHGFTDFRAARLPAGHAI